MPHLVSFRTAKFEIGAEDPNPFNPIAGQGVLKWLRNELARFQYMATEPGAEDWGWYIDVQGHGAAYLVGASADAPSPTPDVEWIVQGHKRRSLKERILGRNAMADDDPLVALVERILRDDPQIADVSIERVR